MHESPNRDAETTDGAEGDISGEQTRIEEAQLRMSSNLYQQTRSNRTKHEQLGRSVTRGLNAPLTID